MPVETPQTTSLFTGWLLRIMLLLAAVMGLLAAGIDMERRLSLTWWAVPAEISAASLKQAMPADWSSISGPPRAVFTTRIVTEGGGETISELYLRRDVIEALLRGEKRRIVHDPDNPRRFRMEDADPPPWGIAWLGFGLVFFGVFLWSLRLK